MLALSSAAVIMDECSCSSASGGPESSTSVATDSEGQTLSLLDKQGRSSDNTNLGTSE